MTREFTRFLSKFYNHFEEVFCVITAGIMVACLMIQVGARWITGGGIPWTEELSRFAFLWTVFIAASLVAKHNAHVRITAQFLLLPVKVRLGFRIFTDILWVFFNLYIAWLSWGVIQRGLQFPEVSPVLHITRSYVEMIIPFGFVVMSWRIIEGYIQRIRQGTLTKLVMQAYEIKES